MLLLNVESFLAVPWKIPQTRSVIQCINLPRVPTTTVVVAVVVDGFIFGKLWFFIPLAVMAGMGPERKPSSNNNGDNYRHHSSPFIVQLSQETHAIKSGFLFAI